MTKEREKERVSWQKVALIEKDILETCILDYFSSPKEALGLPPPSPSLDRSQLLQNLEVKSSG